MIIFQNTRLRAHPVSLGLMEFRQFIVISSYLQEKREVEKINLLIHPADPFPMPSPPQFNGIDQDNSYLINLVESYQLYLERLGVEQEEEDNESGIELTFDEDDYDLESLSDVGEEIIDDEVTKITILYSFNDLCINMINTETCHESECEYTRHTFPSQNEMQSALNVLTKGQFKKAKELLMRSASLKRKYLRLFQQHEYENEE